jgi:hypothetical protein
MDGKASERLESSGSASRDGAGARVASDLKVHDLCEASVQPVRRPPMEPRREQQHRCTETKGHEPEPNEQGYKRETHDAPIGSLASIMEWFTRWGGWLHG